MNARHDDQVSAELLMTRLIDGEATLDDREQFEHLAAAEPTLWRQLAMRQEDMIAMRDAFDDAVAPGLDVDVAQRWMPAMSWPLAMSGWAAVLIALVSFAIVSFAARQGPDDAPNADAVSYLTKYLDAPYVLGDLRPVVLKVHPMSDGRIGVHFVRRIEEIAFLDPEQALPLDDEGELTSDAVLLRRSEPAVGLPRGHRQGQ